MTAITAFRIVAGYALSAASGPDEELVALDCLATVAEGLHLNELDGTLLSQQARRLREADSTRIQLRDLFSGQLNLKLGEEAHGR